MAAVKDLVSVEEYLNTVYRPDCDYVDGELVDRNVGEKDHAKLQWEILSLLHRRSAEWNIFPIHETRVQVSATRFRVPDICVFAGAEPDEQIFTRPPFLCIEILSPEDRIGRMQQRVDDYLSFGVRYVWLIDPKTRRAWVCQWDGMYESRDRVLRTQDPDMIVPLGELWAT